MRKVEGKGISIVFQKQPFTDVQREYTDSTSQFRSVKYPLVAVLRKNFEQLEAAGHHSFVKLQTINIYSQFF